MLASAKYIAETVLAPSARQNDREGRFSIEAISALGEAGLLGLTLPEEVGGCGLGLHSFSGVMAAIAEADASVAMV
jgi:alkylation response protein AidB-like acyl-CoA dehydrogenase